MKVRAWYGLTGEIEVENELWHLVSIGGLRLPHPPLVNLVLRRGLSPEDRRRLSFLHEFGHFQTLPLALVHALWVLSAGRGQRRSLPGWLAWLAAAGLAHEAVWEILSEGYVFVHEGSTYLDVYRRRPNGLVPLFWVVMGVLGIGLSRALWRRR